LWVEFSGITRGMARIAQVIYFPYIITARQVQTVRLWALWLAVG